MGHQTDQAGAQRLLDVPAAAAYLGVSPRFMRRLVAERRVTFVKLGRHVRFDIDDLDRFVESGRVEAAGAAEEWRFHRATGPRSG